VAWLLDLDDRDSDCLLVCTMNNEMMEAPAQEEVESSFQSF
jgi:hypothetical protein